MDVFTLYVGQGALAATRTDTEVIIIDAHMSCGEDDVTQDQIEHSLKDFIGKRRVCGLILTGFDDDHACPTGVESILMKHTPDWVMYPKYYKETDAAAEVFRIIAREEIRRAKTARPLTRHSVRVDVVDSRFFYNLATTFSLELFSPHIDDMDNSNNCSIMVKIQGLDATGFSYLVTGDTEKERADRIAAIFKNALHSNVMAAPHHGATNGVSPASLLSIKPNTVLISAGVDNQYEHPDSAAVMVYRRVAQHVYATNVEGGRCLFTRKAGSDFQTTLVRHPEPAAVV